MQGLVFSCNEFNCCNTIFIALLKHIGMLQGTTECHYFSEPAIWYTYMPGFNAAGTLHNIIVCCMFNTHMSKSDKELP